MATFLDTTPTTAWPMNSKKYRIDKKELTHKSEALSTRLMQQHVHRKMIKKIKR
jgi:hypothetical protein